LKQLWTAVAMSAFLLCAQASLSAEQQPAPDNTKANKQHKTTADKASNKAGDLDAMQKIRKSVMDDKALSTTAHNVKIIAKDGKVTLKGPVNSDDEKATIERLATDVAGAGNVVNQITVKPAHKK
jgi:hyperosmotically inducible protein